MPPKRQQDDSFFAGAGRPKSSGPRGPPSGRPRPTGAKAGGKPYGKNNGGPAKDKGKEKEKDKVAKPQADALILANQPLTAPPSLGEFAALRRLDLSNTGLTSIGFVKQARHTLTWLNVSGNPLDSVEAWDGVNELSGLYGKLNQKAGGAVEKVADPGEVVVPSSDGERVRFDRGAERSRGPSLAQSSRHFTQQAHLTRSRKAPRSAQHHR